MAGETLLVISGLGVPPYSARGLEQTLNPIQGSGDFDRDVNGGMVDLSDDNFKKLASTISCEDVEPPAFDGNPVGLEVTVDCIRELAYLTASGTAQRPVVDDSERIVGDWTYYRPRLQMIIVNFSSSQSEYGRSVSWTLDLEEV